MPAKVHTESAKKAPPYQDRKSTKEPTSAEGDVTPENGAQWIELKLQSLQRTVPCVLQLGSCRCRSSSMWARCSLPAKILDKSAACECRQQRSPGACHGTPCLRAGLHAANAAVRKPDGRREIFSSSQVEPTSRLQRGASAAVITICFLLSRWQAQRRDWLT